MGRRKKSKSKASKEDSSSHMLPSGFWRQVGALLMIAFSVLLVLSWFGSGGTALKWVHDSTLYIIGYAIYLLPLLLIYLAVAIFRRDDNRVPVVVTVASILIITWFAGIFGLFENSAGETTGGVIGSFINGGILSMVDKGVAFFIYLLLIFITILFVLSISPITVIKKVSGSFRSGKTIKENDNNLKIIKKIDESGSKTSGELKLNASVPTLDPSDKKSLDKAEKAKADSKPALIVISDPDWKLPSMDLLEKRQSPADAGNIQQNAQIIKNTLHEFDIDVEMEGANIGPKVTQFTLKPPSGVKLTKITALENNIALNLAAQSLRIEAPIPGQRAVGIEVPNVRAADVRLFGILDSKQWKHTVDKLNFAVGSDISGEPIIGELGIMPHLLIAGQTGSGKSVMINTLICSLLYRNSPSDLRIILVDPKQVEMAPYEDIPHLLTPIITEPEKTVSALKWAVNEMERRYNLLASKKARDIDSYNQKVVEAAGKIPVADENGEIPEPEEGKMPYVVIIIDELADLMMAAGREVEALVVRLAQKARAVGIHLVLATQRPSVDVITGLIKANIPARIAFTVASQVDSRTILDQIGAEKLLGKGDMLFLTPTMNKPKRIQGAWVTDAEVSKITDFLREQSPPRYNPDVVSQPVQLSGKGGVVMDYTESSSDPMYQEAVRLVVGARKASASMLQMQLRLGYARAARIIQEMENQGIISPPDGARPREVLISSLDEIGVEE